MKQLVNVQQLIITKRIIIIDTMIMVLSCIAFGMIMGSKF